MVVIEAVFAYFTSGYPTIFLTFLEICLLIRLEVEDFRILLVFLLFLTTFFAILKYKQFFQIQII